MASRKQTPAVAILGQIEVDQPPYGLTAPSKKRPPQQRTDPRGTGLRRFVKDQRFCAN